MHVATLNDPKFAGWAKHFADGEKHEPSIECRLAVRLSEDAAYSLIDFEADSGRPVAERLGWDLRRQHGGSDGAGSDMFRTLFAASGGKRRHPDGYCDQLWRAFDRPRADSDRLLIDVADDAIYRGWEAPAEIVAEVEKLRDAKEAQKAQRDLGEEAALQAECDAENNRLDELFFASRRIAREHPEWLQIEGVSERAAACLQHIINSDSYDVISKGRVIRADPVPQAQDEFIAWVVANVEYMNSDKDFQQMLIDVKLTAKRLEAEVSRNLMPFTNFQVTKVGIPDPMNPDNVRIFLRMHQTELRWNEWNCRSEIREFSSWGDARKQGPWTPLTDAILGRLMTQAGNSQYQFRPAEALFRRTVATIAHETPYDPLIERLAALESAWDGVPRLSGWLARATGVVDDDYHTAVSRNVVGGMVRRAREPGCKHDEVLLLASAAQGMGKSTLCRILALEDAWFSDSVVFDGSPQNVVPQLFGKWCIELSELGNMGRRDAEHVKRFLSTQADNYTAKYQAIATDNARRCVFVGTTNAVHALSDETGGRRWLPVNVPGEIDLEWLRLNVEQIIGEAATLHTRGESFAIPRDVWTAAAKRQEAARAVSPVEEFCYEWFDRPTVAGAGLWIRSTDIVHALKLSGQSGNAKYGAFLKKLGYRDESIVVPEIGKRTRLWVRSEGNGIEGCIQLVPVQRQAGMQVEMQMRSLPISLPTSGVPLPVR